MNFLFFRRMLTPLIIELIFWLIVVLCITGGIINIFHHEMLHGLQIMIIGPILVRVVCEVLILFFRMNESLTEIKKAVQEKP